MVELELDLGLVLEYKLGLGDKVVSWLVLPLVLHIELHLGSKLVLIRQAS